jgi:phage gp29-like protein
MAMLVDQFGRPIEDLKKPDTKEISTVAISDRWSSYPSEGLTPQKLASYLKFADQGDVYSQAELFEEMEEKDTHLSAEILKRKNAVMGLDYDILPYEEGARTPATKRSRGRPAQTDKVLEFCQDVTFSLPSFEDALFDLLDAIGKGFSGCEIVWEVSGGKVIPAKLKWIHQKRFTFVDSLEPKLITEENRGGEDIQPFKVIYHRHKARSGYDTRVGMLRVCAWMYLFKNYSIKDWVRFAEVFGMPLRVGKYEPGASKEDKEALRDAIQSLGTDAAGIISKNTEIEFIEALKAATKENIFNTLASFCNREMSKAIVGATLTTEVGERGSFAASKTHNEVRLDLVKSDSWALSNTVRMQLLRPLVGFNFGWDAPVPWFRFYLQEPEDLKELSEVYKNLAEMGQPISAEHVSERFSVPMPQEGETLLQTPTMPTSLKKRFYALKSAPERFGQDDADELSSQGAQEAEEAISKLLEPVLEMIESAGSLEEIGEKIYGLYPNLDSSDFQELLTRAVFAAGLTGFAAAEGDSA